MAGNTYQLLSKDGNFGVFKFNAVNRRFMITKYCGVDAVVQYGKVLIKSDKIAPQIDPELDIPKQIPVYKLNTKNYRYIDVLKKHKIS